MDSSQKGNDDVSLSELLTRATKDKEPTGDTLDMPSLLHILLHKVEALEATIGVMSSKIKTIEQNTSLTTSHMFSLMESNSEATKLVKSFLIKTKEDPRVTAAVYSNLSSQEKGAATRAIVGYFSASLVKSIYMRF